MGSFVQQPTDGNAVGSKENEFHRRMELIQKSGYDFVEFPVAIVAPDKPEAEYKPLITELKKYRIAPEVYNCFISLKLTGEGVDYNAIEKYLETAISRVAETGGKIIVFGSGGARRVTDGFPIGKGYAQLVKFLEMVNPVAEKYNVDIAIEPLNKQETNIINTVKEGIKLAEDVGLPRIKVLADLYHVAQENEPFENILPAGADLIHVHVADTKRWYPGSGNYDYNGFFATLKKMGYNGRICAEWVYKEFDPEAKQTIKFLKKKWKEVEL